MLTYEECPRGLLTCKKLLPERWPWLYIPCENLSLFNFYLFYEHLISISKITGNELEWVWAADDTGKKYVNNTGKINPLLNYHPPLKSTHEILTFKPLLKYSAVTEKEPVGRKYPQRSVVVQMSTSPFFPVFEYLVPRWWDFW